MSHHRPPDPHSHKPQRHTHSAPHAHPVPPSVAQEMQIRALREALYRSARDTDTVRQEVEALREALRLERKRSMDLELRCKQVMQAVGTRPPEIDALREENRRLRSMIANESAERIKLVEELRAVAPPQPPQPRPKNVAAVAPDVAFEP